MKTLKNIYILALLALTTVSCGLDNYDAPESKLHGQVVYKDANGVEHAIGVRGTGEAVRLKLYQYGYDLKDGIDVFLTQNAQFESVLFDGEYHLVPQKDNGPWKTIQVSEAKKDTIDFVLTGTTTLKVYVLPYYMLYNSAIRFDGTTFTATCDIEKVISDAAVDQVGLFVSTTQFVDESSNFIRKDYGRQQPGLGQQFELTVTDENQKKAIDLARSRTGKVYARIGLKPAGSDQYVYSDVQEIRL
ncbi:MAG: DUF3823 domain-containing protein [Tannerellaceae bacterium]